MQIARSALRPVARLSTEAPLVARQVTSSCSKLPIAAARATTVPALSRAFTSTPIRQLLEEPTDPHPPSRLLRTPLYDFHVQNGGKMVEFAGWDMPLSYGSVGQIAAHHHVRTAAGLFDVSHMLQHRFTGPGAQAFLSWLCPSSLSALAPWTSTLSVLVNDQGGIIDDMMVTKHADESAFYVVTNAGRSKEDREWIEKKLGEWRAKAGNGEVQWETLDGWGLVALQGPKSMSALQKLTDTDLSELKFGFSQYVTIGGVECHVARGGYTGEDGFEIAIPPASAVEITQKIASDPDVQLTGLGARDSLRLEAGMCLYGHDLDETVSPIEAGLAWLVGKDRRAAGDFIGASRILREIKEGPSRRRVGFVVEGSPAREGAEIYSADGQEQIGIVTSGIPSPTLGKNIAMGYVKNGHHKKGTDVQVKVRKNMRKAVVTPMPFVPAKYYR